MNYIIKNSKNVFIRLNKDGCAISCSEADRQLFDYRKAKNIYDSLPKTLKKLKFNVEAVPDIPSTTTNETKPEKIITTNDYMPPDEVTRWIEKFGICDDILNEAKERKKELNEALSNADKEMSNIIHAIELEPPKDMYHGWLLYKSIRLNRKQRRNIKDELLVISSVLRMDLRNLNVEDVKKIIIGLSNRKFTFRVVEEDDEEVDISDNM